MSNRRKDRRVPKGFTRYVIGTYEKRDYTIITFNGVRYEKCWPNAGQFHPQRGPHKYIPESEVFAVKTENAA